MVLQMGREQSSSMLAGAVDSGRRGAVPSRWSRARVVPLLVLAACGGAKGVGDTPTGANPEGTHATRAAVPLTFADLGGWPYTDGVKGMPESIKRFAGQRVEMVGHLLPIEGVEALLVESLKQFVPCQGPEINQIVHVALPEKPAMETLQHRVKVIGLFSVGATVMDGYCVDIYQVRAESVTVIE